MKLYMVPLAPNPTKVMLYIAERKAMGLDMGIEQIIVNTLKARHREPAHLARNPFGTLPVLELDDGSYIMESRVMIDYLEDIFPKHRLLSADPQNRAFERDIERICEIRLANHIDLWVHMYKSPIGLKPNPQKAAELEAMISPALDFLERLLSDDRAFLCGERVSIADCTLQASLQFMRFTGGDIIGEHPLLRQWDSTYRARPHLEGIIQW